MLWKFFRTTDPINSGAVVKDEAVLSREIGNPVLFQSNCTATSRSLKNSLCKAASWSKFLKRSSAVFLIENVLGSCFINVGKYVEVPHKYCLAFYEIPHGHLSFRKLQVCLQWWVFGSLKIGSLSEGLQELVFSSIIAGQYKVK